MANRRFEMYQYRQIIARMRQGILAFIIFLVLFGIVFRFRKLGKLSISNSQKPELSEAEIAGHFVLATMNAARADWPKFERELEDTFAERADCQFPDFEIALAILSVQMQAVKNLCPPAVAARIRAKIFEYLKSAEMGNSPSEIVEKYQSVWDQSNGTDIRPWDAVSGILYERLGFTKSVKVGTDEFKSPLVLTALTERTTFLIGPWWKTQLQKFTLVE